MQIHHYHHNHRLPRARLEAGFGYQFLTTHCSAGPSTYIIKQRPENKAVYFDASALEYGF